MRRTLFALLLLLPLTERPASAQGNRATSTPLIASIFPPGAPRGATTEWTLTGRGFNRAREIIGAGPGVKVVDFSAVSDTQAKVTVDVSAGAPLGFRELRVDGPDGISNLVLVRIDGLAQVLEIEPNDEADKAQEVAEGVAVVGILRPTDIDHYRIKGRPGQRLTLDLEARRLGTTFTPVLTAMASSGTSIGQARAWPGGDRDCRLGIAIPADGVLVVQVRDNTYGGNDLAAYRLRIDSAPYATGLFPLGGPRGKSVTVSVSGGSLDRPLSRSIQLPDQGETEIDLADFPSPAGPVRAPQKFVVGDEGEVNEPPPGSASAPLLIKAGETVNGRIDQPGEIDRYRLAVKKGDRIRLKIQAGQIGSWIDSVVSIRSPKGDTLAENDDEGAGNAQANRVNALGLTEGSSDSTLDYTATADGELSVEVTDRYGEGGPEYGYRLAVGRTRPDFSVNLLLGNPNAGIAQNGQGMASARLAPGLMGVFNLRPGSTTSVNFLIKSVGSPGKIMLAVEGAPQGILAEPVVVDLSAPLAANAPRERSTAGSLVLRVESFASPGVGQMRVVAISTPTGEKSLTRVGSAIIGLQGTNVGVQSLPITRTLSEFPVRILGESRVRFVGPPSPPSLIRVVSPGPLLQGDRLDLALEFDTSPLTDPGFSFDATAEGVGLATNTVISSGLASSEEDPPPDVMVRVLASPKTQPGVYPVRIKAGFSGGRAQEQEVSVVVRAPLELSIRDGALPIKPGGTASLHVAVRREPGCDGEIEFKVDGLPRGVKLARGVTLAEGQSEGDLAFEMAPTARALRTARELTIIADARMPRGAVPVESTIRPMMVAAPADQ